MLLRFIRKYLRGLGSAKFQDLVGFEVMVNNFWIFLHVLWRLYFNDWLEPDEVAGYFLDTFTLFLLSPGGSANLEDLAAEERKLAFGWLTERPVAGIMLAHFFYANSVLRKTGNDGLRIKIRDAWREYLKRQTFTISEEDLTIGWVLVGSLEPVDPLPPPQIVSDLQDLADFETRSTIQRQLEGKFGYPLHAIRFERPSVMRAPLERNSVVDAVIINRKDAHRTEEEARSLISEWMRMEQLDYYRASSQGSACGAFFDCLDHRGVYLRRGTGNDVTINWTTMTPAGRDWDEACQDLKELASRVSPTLELATSRLEESDKLKRLE